MINKFNFCDMGIYNTIIDEPIQPVFCELNELNKFKNGIYLFPGRCLESINKSIADTN